MAKKSLKKILLEEIEAEERFQKEFLTEKERKSFEQVEKFVSKNWKEVEENLRKKKSERLVDDDFKKFSSKWEKDRYENARLESMISQVAVKSNWSWWVWKDKQYKTLYIIYIIVLFVAVIFCVIHYLKWFM